MYQIKFLSVNVSFCLFWFACAAFRGPHPSDIAPSSYASVEAESEPVPLNPPSCVRSTAPVVKNVSVHPFVYDPSIYQLTSDVDWCKSFDTGIRFRVLEFQGTKENPVTRVLSAETWLFLTYYNTGIDRRCKPFRVYLEACVSFQMGARPSCFMSEVMTVGALSVPEPHLTFRPPYFVRLAPGDAVEIVSKLESSAVIEGHLEDDKHDRVKRSILIRSVAQSQYGRQLKATPFKEGKRSVLRISSKDTSQWNTRKFFNGASVFLQFATPSCPSIYGSYKKRYATKLMVSGKVKSLVKQDNQLPSIKQPTFPAIRSGRDVTLYVNATNIGGGLRRGGAKTKLHYQWLKQTTYSEFWESHAIPIKGETGPILKVKNVVCKSPRYVRSGLRGLKHYFVDVCNTYGCKRSDVIKPRYIGKNEAIISDEDCSK